MDTEEACTNKRTFRLLDTKEILQRVSEDSDSRIASERGHGEKMAIENMNLTKQLEEMKQAHGRSLDRIRELEQKSSEHDGVVTKYGERMAGLEAVIADAANVIRFYSSASDGKESSVEVVKLKNLTDKLQRENDNLRTKLEQNQYEATQEQRLITTSWNEMVGVMAAELKCCKWWFSAI